MHRHTLAHLSDETLLHALSELVARERDTTADVLAHIAEVDMRRLYLPSGHSSMHTYCVDVLGLSDDAAYKRIQVARASRQFPILLDALADGRLHLAGACLLVPHLTPQNAEGLLDMATHRRKSEIDAHLARAFPTTRASEPKPIVRALPAIRPLLAPGQVERGSAPGFEGSQLRLDEAGDSMPLGDVRTPEPSEEPTDRTSIPSESATGETESELAPGQVGEPSRQPSHAERYLVRVTIGRDLHDKLRYAQALLSHAVPSGDVAEVLERALDTLITQLEKRKIGSRTRSRTFQRIVRQTRHIPAAVREAVWDRDQSRCTFVGANGHRCEARRLLEFDHVKPFARGGKATVDALRLRCRAHNQYEAERVFGSEFMRRKRAQSRQKAARNRAAGDAPTPETEVQSDSDPTRNTPE